MTAPQTPPAKQTAYPAARAFTLAGGLILAVTLVDQVSKWVMVDYFSTNLTALKVTGFFNLVLTYNTGISFGIFRDGEDWVRWALAIASFAIMAVLLDWLRRQPGKALALAIGLVCGGALGNVIDRIWTGAVIDFLDFHLAGWHWPAFNVADSAITLGVMVLILDGLFQKPRYSKE